MISSTHNSLFETFFLFFQPASVFFELCFSPILQPAANQGSCLCSCMLSASLPQSNLQMSTPIKEATTFSTHKWGLDQDSNKENQSPGQASSPPKKRKYAKRRTTDDKLRDIFNEIHRADWALSDFLYLVFRHKDADGKEIKHNHGNAVQRFLTGGCIYTPGHIINSWFHSPYGHEKDASHVFSNDAVYGDFICSIVPYIICCSSCRTAIGSGSYKCCKTLQWPSRSCFSQDGGEKSRVGRHRDNNCSRSGGDLEEAPASNMALSHQDRGSKTSCLRWGGSCSEVATRRYSKRFTVHSGLAKTASHSIKLGLYKCPGLAKFLAESTSPTTTSGEGPIIFCVLGARRSICIRVPNRQHATI